MGNLIVDIGNTAVKAAFTEGVTLGKTFRYQGERVKNFILSLTAREKPEVMVISSVYEIHSRDEAEYSAVCGRLVILDSAHTSLLRDSNLPGWLSFDRAASIIAVRHLFNGKSCTIIDFGTTLTVDFIDSDGRYEGGNISLGCRTRFKAINRYSRSLPLIDTPEDSPALGNSLDTSISSGILSGIMFEISGYVSEKQDNIVVFTGGDANYFAKRIKNSIFVICNLVLIGLALIADGYVNEKN
ncbi:MAG: type III pantothenate kinase [Candidatus Cryptobacteroides sp.]